MKKAQERNLFLAKLSFFVFVLANFVSGTFLEFLLPIFILVYGFFQLSEFEVNQNYEFIFWKILPLFFVLGYGILIFTFGDSSQDFSILMSICSTFILLSFFDRD